jgi:hypothetical protein
MAVSVSFVRRWLLCAMGVLALSGCVDDSALAPPANAPVASAPAATSSSSSGPAGVVPDTLTVTAPLVGGGTIDLAQYAGTPVLLWFWAPT